MIESSQTVGEIAAEFPVSTRVFGRHKINFCCGGGISLAEACERRALGLEDVVAELELEIERAAATELDGWAQRPTPELVEFILERYHRPLDEELPRLQFLADKVARVHGERDESLREIARVYGAMKAELDHHFQKEEMILFPAVLAGQGAQLAGPVSVMLKDHDDAADLLAQLRELTRDYAVPDQACGSWRALWSGLEDLERSLHEHIHLENNILFPRLG